MESMGRRIERPAGMDEGQGCGWRRNQRGEGSILGDHCTVRRGGGGWTFHWHICQVGKIRRRRERRELWIGGGRGVA